MPLPEDLVVWYTQKNLPKEYDILKQMILCDSLPTYNKLELRLISEEMSRKVQKLDEKDVEALAASFHPSCRKFGTCQGNRSDTQNPRRQPSENIDEQNSRAQYHNPNSSYQRLGGAYQRPPTNR